MSFLWTDHAVREALGPRPGTPPMDLEFRGVSTDSRTVEPGDLFIALEGDRFDGHDFVRDAVARGARGVVARGDRLGELGQKGTFTGVGLYEVGDTLRALGDLARYRRRATEARVVGITGSSGKTTTKNLLAAALEGSLRVHTTPGNLNNRIGLPLTILAAPEGIQVMVLEMGTNEPGEIRALTEIAEPEIGLITTVGETHLEKLGTLEGVLEEKLDLFRGLSEDGLGVVGDDPPVLEERGREVVPRLVVAGLSPRSTPEYRAEGLASSGDGTLRFRWRGETVELRMPGRHSVQNALLALAVADVLGVPARDAAHRVGTVEATGMRSEIRRLGDLTLVVDCYNANPQSLKAALDLLASLEGGGKRVAVLGSMLELGPGSREIHRESLDRALDSPLDLVVATGLFAEAAEDLDAPPSGPELLVAPDLDRALEVLLAALAGSELVLLKASRGVAMETLIPALNERFGPGEGA